MSTMADTIAVADSSHREEDELSDEQMQEILARAAKRRQDKASVKLADESGNKQFAFPKLNTGDIAKPYVSTTGDVAKIDSSRLLQEKDRILANKIRKVEDPVVVENRKAESKKATAGAQWYNLPRTDLTPELKRDLQLLKMRNVLDPHRHYKKENGKLRPPEYSQVGTIVEGPTEYYSARLTNKDRKRTFVEEVLAGEQANGRFSKKYGDVQVNKTSGKKAYYKSVQDKRSKKR